MLQLRVPALAREENPGLDTPAKRNTFDHRLAKKHEYVADWKEDGTAVIEPLFAAVMDGFPGDDEIEDERRPLYASVYVRGEFLDHGMVGLLPQEVTPEEFATADDIQHARWMWQLFGKLGYAPVTHDPTNYVWSLRQY